MAVVVHVTLRGVTPEQYDAVRAHAGWIERPPSGGLFHTTWWESGDCHNLDAWESEEAFAAFAEQRLGPAMVAARVAAQPETAFHPAHEVFLPRAGTIAPTAPAMGTVDNVSVVRSGYDAFARGDLEAVLALFDPAIRWYAPDTVRLGGSYSGPAGVGEFFAKLPENYAELQVQPAAFVDRADTVVTIGRHRGRSAAGIAFDLPFVHVWTLANGKVTSFTEHFDTVKMNAALAPAGQPDAVRQAAGKLAQHA